MAVLNPFDIAIKLCLVRSPIKRCSALQLLVMAFQAVSGKGNSRQQAPAAALCRSTRLLLSATGDVASAGSASHLRFKVARKRSGVIFIGFRKRGMADGLKRFIAEGQPYHRAGDSTAAARLGDDWRQ